MIDASAPAAAGGIAVNGGAPSVTAPRGGRAKDRWSAVGSPCRGATSTEMRVGAGECATGREGRARGTPAAVSASVSIWRHGPPSALRRPGDRARHVVCKPA